MYIPEIPQNSLAKEITTIVELSRQLENESDFEFEEPATEEALSSWELNYSIKIPESLKDWLRFTEYANIDNYMVVIRSPKSYVVNPDLSDDLVIIGELIGDGELLCFSKTDGRIVWEDHGTYRYFSDFKEFLKEVIRMLSKNGGLSQSSIDVLMNLANRARMK